MFGSYPACRESVAQDWPAWVKAGYLDFVCPMDYTASDAEFVSLVRSQMKLIGGRVPLYPGIGATATGMLDDAGPRGGADSLCPIARRGGLYDLQLRRRHGRVDRARRGARRQRSAAAAAPESPDRRSSHDAALEWPFNYCIVRAELTSYGALRTRAVRIFAPVGLDAHALRQRGPWQPGNFARLRHYPWGTLRSCHVHSLRFLALDQPAVDEVGDQILGR